jgi:hypothetical protein
MRVSAFPFPVIFGLLAVRAVAAPANDSFSGASALPAALPVTATVDLTGATTESNEPVIDGGGSTVWWNWTPAVSGWVKISAGGAGNPDTVLGLYTGSSVSALTTVMQNDIGAAALGPSDLIVQVTAGQPYRVQAGGAGGWQGTMNLSITSYLTPPQITAITNTPAAPNVTSQIVDVTGTISFTHPAGLADSDLYLMWPDGVTVYDISKLVEFTRVSGTATAGTYSLFHRLYRYLPPGKYPYQVVARALDGASVIYGRTTPFPAGITGTLTIANTGIVDETPPELVSLNMSATIVDVTTAAKTVTVTVHTRDALSPVFETLSRLELRRADLSARDTVPLTYQNRTSGNPAATPGDATWAVDFSFPAGSPPGQYSLGLTLTDQLLNQA